MAEDIGAQRAEVRAKLTSPGGYGVFASASEHTRYVVPRTGRRGRRWCPFCLPARQRVTHLGRANGLTLTSGCELHMRRWSRG